MSKKHLTCPSCGLHGEHSDVCAYTLIGESTNASLGDWVMVQNPEDHGYAIIRVSTRSEAIGEMKAHQIIDDIVRANHYGFTISPLVGYYAGKQEPSFAITLINGSDWVVPWKQFRAQVRQTAEELSAALMQIATLVEYVKNGGVYEAVEYKNPYAEMHALYEYPIPPATSFYPVGPYELPQ